MIPIASDKLRLHTMGPTPTITILVPGPLRPYCAGAADRNVCDETGTLRRHLNVFVNSDNVRDLDGVDTRLSPGDVVTILPAVSGG
ncbi:MAG: molybdopterin synthase sulfur carrier subunit [Acidobacteria bacterium]|nr:MAG: molybdopterin synthase sulfur carrier subunit [Acidobacteriota bacterium]